MQTHERWFTEDTFETDWSFAARPAALAAVVSVVLVTLAWRAVAVRFPSPELPFLHRVGRLTPWLPRLVGVHLGVALLALAARGDFLSPSLPLEDLPASGAAALVEGAVGVWLITGYRLRWAGAAVAALGPALLVGAGPVALLENAALLGIALFLVFAPASDHGRHGEAHHPAHRLQPALLVLRVGAAVSLVSLAFSEKLTNPAMARATLHEHPELNVLDLVGLPVSTDAFIVIAGAVELLFGLLVLSGAAPQVAVLVAAVPFNLTLLLFGAPELIGHLPVYGILLTLLAYGSDPRTAPLVRSLRLDALRAPVHAARFAPAETREGAAL